MSKKYKKIDIPLDTYLKFKKRQMELSRTLSKVSGKQKKVTFTRTLAISADAPIYLFDWQLKNNKRRKK